MTAREFLDRQFLEMRCDLLDLAAALDRIERADGYREAATDHRLKQLSEAVAIVQSSGADRAERIQLLFSDAYDPHWQRTGSTGP